MNMRSSKKLSGAAAAVKPRRIFLPRSAGCGLRARATGERIFPGKISRRFTAPAARRVAMMAGCLIALPLLCAAQSTNQFNIPWSSINAGGGASSGGNYTMSGIIGQPDTGMASGGPYGVAGGFWVPAVVIQEPGAPMLRLTLATGGLVIAWPAPSTGFQLQESTSLVPAVTWTDVTQVPMILNGEKTITNLPIDKVRFFRLRKP